MQIGDTADYKSALRLRVHQPVILLAVLDGVADDIFVVDNGHG